VRLAAAGVLHFSGRRIIDVLGFVAVCVMLWWIVFEAILAVWRML
jgi:hypothetical protein